MSTNSSPPTRTVADWFNAMSTSYAHSTGNTTSTLLTLALSSYLPSTFLTPSTILHDNACGPGTATIAAVTHSGAEPARVEATDTSPGMIAAAQHTIKAAGWERVTATVMDSQALEFGDATFTASITNFSTTNMSDPSLMFSEVARTLQSGGTGLWLGWKRFTVAEMVHEAQRAVKGDGVELMKVPKAEWMGEGVIAKGVRKAGLRGVEQREVSFVVKGEEMEGLRGFMLGGFTKEARSGWTEEELGAWEGKVDEALGREVERFGGVRMEAWVVWGTK